MTATHMERNREVQEACDVVRGVLEQHPGPWSIPELEEKAFAAATCSLEGIQAAMLGLMGERELVRDADQLLVYRPLAPAS